MNLNREIMKKEYLVERIEDLILGTRGQLNAYQLSEYIVDLLEELKMSPPPVAVEDEDLYGGIKIHYIRKWEDE